MKQTGLPAPAEQKARRQTRLLLVALVLLNVADAIISQFIISNGYGSEGNALLSYWINRREFVFIKAGAAALAAIILWDLSRRAPRPTLAVTTIIVVVYILIVAWNILVAASGGIA